MQLVDSFSSDSSLSKFEKRTSLFFWSFKYTIQRGEFDCKKYVSSLVFWNSTIKKSILPYDKYVWLMKYGNKMHIPQKLTVC